MTGGALWADGEGTIHHFTGLGAAATWGNLALVMRTSTDYGATWTRGRLVDPEHGLGRMPSFVSFAKSITWTNDDGNAAVGSGLFVALSFDEGETRPWKRLVSNDTVSEPEIWNGGACLRSKLLLKLKERL